MGDKDSETPSSFGQVQEEMKLTEEELRAAMEEKEEQIRRQQGRLSTCPLRARRVGLDAVPLEPIRIGASEAQPVCEPEPEPEQECEDVCEPQPPISTWNIMDQDIEFGEAPMTPQARLYDPNIQVCPRPGSPIPMGISDEERAAALAALDPYYTGEGPKTKKIPFPHVIHEPYEVDPDEAGELANVFGYEDEWKLLPDVEFYEMEEEFLRLPESEPLGIEGALTYKPTGELADDVWSDESLEYMEAEDMPDEFDYDPTIECLDDIDFKPPTVDQLVLSQLAAPFKGVLPSHRMTKMSKDFKYEQCIERPRPVYGLPDIGHLRDRLASVRGRGQCPAPAEGPAPGPSCPQPPPDAGPCPCPPSTMYKDLNVSQLAERFAAVRPPPAMAHPTIAPSAQAADQEEMEHLEITDDQLGGFDYDPTIERQWAKFKLTPSQVALLDLERGVRKPQTVSARLPSQRVAEMVKGYDYERCLQPHSLRRRRPDGAPPDPDGERRRRRRRQAGPCPAAAGAPPAVEECPETTDQPAPPPAAECPETAGQAPPPAVCPETAVQTPAADAIPPCEPVAEVAPPNQPDECENMPDFEANYPPYCERDEQEGITLQMYNRKKNMQLNFLREDWKRKQARAAKKKAKEALCPKPTRQRVSLAPTRTKPSTSAAAACPRPSTATRKRPALPSGGRPKSTGGAKRAMACPGSQEGTLATPGPSGVTCPGTSGGAASEVAACPGGQQGTSRPPGTTGTTCPRPSSGAGRAAARPASQQRTLRPPGSTGITCPGPGGAGTEVVCPDSQQGTSAAPGATGVTCPRASSGAGRAAARPGSQQRSLRPRATEESCPPPRGRARPRSQQRPLRPPGAPAGSRPGTSGGAAPPQQTYTGYDIDMELCRGNIAQAGSSAPPPPRGRAAPPPRGRARPKSQQRPLRPTGAAGGRCPGTSSGTARPQQQAYTNYDIDMELCRGNAMAPSANPPRMQPPERRQSRISQLAQPKRRC